MIRHILFFIPFIKGEPLYTEYVVQEDYVPILGYHSIGEYTDSLTTTVSDFRDQVEYLTNTAKCNWITMDRLAYYIENQEKLPTNACIMNFDDGDITQYENTICTLNEYKIPATYYIAIDNIGRNRYYMTSNDLKKLKNKGHDIEAHTLTHARLTELSYEEQEGEILGSKVKLEEDGYVVKTFAYPYGAYNDDTLDILQKSDFVLARDTSQDYGWKDVRSPIVSFNENSLYHFFYFKPEGYVGNKLWEKLQYTGWWQIEDNYKIINEEKTNGIKISSSSWYLPTDISYAIVYLSNKNDEIATQFLTKYTGGFTLDIMVGNKTQTIPIRVKVDGVEYEVYSYNYTHSNSLRQRSGAVDYYNFYINIDELSPGLHQLNFISNDDEERVYLDRFRLFSNVEQDFTDIMFYKECNPETEQYCTCDQVDKPDELEEEEEKDPLKTLYQTALMMIIISAIVCFLVCILFIFFNCKD